MEVRMEGLKLDLYKNGGGGLEKKEKIKGFESKKKNYDWIIDFDGYSYS